MSPPVKKSAAATDTRFAAGQNRLGLGVGASATASTRRQDRRGPASRQRSPVADLAVTVSGVAGPAAARRRRPRRRARPRPRWCPARRFCRGARAVHRSGRRQVVTARRRFGIGANATPASTWPRHRARPATQRPRPRWRAGGRRQRSFAAPSRPATPGWLPISVPRARNQEPERTGNPDLGRPALRPTAAAASGGSTMAAG